MAGTRSQAAQKAKSVAEGSAPSNDKKASNGSALTGGKKNASGSAFAAKPKPEYVNLISSDEDEAPAPAKSRGGRKRGVSQVESSSVSALSKRARHTNEASSGGKATGEATDRGKGKAKAVEQPQAGSSKELVVRARGDGAAAGIRRVAAEDAEDE